MGNIESVDGQAEMKHHIMPLKVPMPDPTELEEKFAIVLVSGCHTNISSTLAHVSLDLHLPLKHNQQPIPPPYPVFLLLLCPSKCSILMYVHHFVPAAL